MRNKSIIIFIIIVAIVLVVIVMVDFSSTKPDKRPDNPYEYSIEEFKGVNPELIKYKESKQININAEMPHGIDYNNQKIYLIADNYLQVINKSGKQISKNTFSDTPFCIDISANEKIVLGFKNYIAILNKENSIEIQSEIISEKSIFTSVAINNNIYVADAGNRKVLIYNMNAEKIGEFKGESGESDRHGFIIPSPYFDLAINNNNELWVCNPGIHALQNYTDEGKLRGYWENASMQIQGFSGCCNPAHFTFLPNGNFVTSEKGLPRIKEYKPSGELVAVVAPPEKFVEDGHAPDLTTDENGNIIALDFNKKLIRFFKPKI